MIKIYVSSKQYVSKIGLFHPQVELSKREKQSDTIRNQWRTERGGLGGSNPPRNSEILTKLSRIPCSVENTSVTVYCSYSITLISLKIAEFRTPTLKMFGKKAVKF
jgi:hypothetical protein